jgi:hypothetical protein
MSGTSQAEQRSTPNDRDRIGVPQRSQWRRPTRSHMAQSALAILGILVPRVDRRPASARASGVRRPPLRSRVAQIDSAGGGISGLDLPSTRPSVEPQSICHVLVESSERPGSTPRTTHHAPPCVLCSRLRGAGLPCPYLRPTRLPGDPSQGRAQRVAQRRRRRPGRGVGRRVRAGARGEVRAADKLSGRRRRTPMRRSRHGAGGARQAVRGAASLPSDPLRAPLPSAPLREHQGANHRQAVGRFEFSQQNHAVPVSWWD